MNLEIQSNKFNIYCYGDELVETPGSRRIERIDNRRRFERMISTLDERVLPGKDYLKDFLVQRYRRNLKISTLSGHFRGIRDFLIFVNKDVERITREDLASFIEHEQDRGLKIKSVHARLSSIYTFFHFLIDREVLGAELLLRKIRLKLPDSLPRAMNPYDVQRLLAEIDHVRDRAMVLLLLRSGMRIGELLARKVGDVNMGERKIMIHQGEKNQVGRVVCFSEDAHAALEQWFEVRDSSKEYLFYAQGRMSLGYSGVRVRFARYVEAAGLSHKDYTLHCLRHTFATELLNAGMRLECLQQLLGHSDIEVTRQYARMSDRTREEEYFKAMAVIERRQADGCDQLGSELQTLFEAPKPLA